VVFLPPAQNLFEPTKELLSRYAASSSHIRVRLVDPEKNPVETERLVRQYNVTAPGVVVASGNDRRVIDSNDLGEFDYSGMQFGQQPQMTGFKGEQLVTSALLQLAEGRKPKVLFTTGHGEHTLDDNGPHGLSGAQELLGRDNFDIQEWASLGKPVPPGTDLVVVAGPTSSFVKPELDALTSYVESGGRVLVLLDPTLGQTPGTGLVSTGLEGWLSGYGVKVGQNIVVDPSNPLPFFGAETIAVKDYVEHPITKPLKQGNLPILMSLVRSIGAATQNGATGLAATELMRTSAQGWGETDLEHLEKVARDDKDLAGPVPLGVAIEKKGAPAPAGAPPVRAARIVAFGDSDFATNQLLQANVANSVLLADSLNWLVEREALLGIPPKKTEQVHLSLTQQQLRAVYLLTLVLLPGLAVAGGVFVYFRRRR
ncbi:MAG TPA: GldG family protein, partial [Thermoanaerobaculia bacterium]